MREGTKHKVLILYVNVNHCMDRVSQSVDVSLPQSLANLMLAQWSSHGGRDGDCPWNQTAWIPLTKADLLTATVENLTYPQQRMILCPQYVIIPSGYKPHQFVTK